MKPLRAVSALLFQLLLLLQVGMIGSGMACAPDGGRGAHGPTAPAGAGGAGAGAAHAGAAHAGHRVAAAAGATAIARAASAEGEAGQPARGPATPDHHGMPSHCATAAGCAAVAAEAPRLAVASLGVGQGAVHAGRVSLPRSTHPAPEPPPPRA